MRRVIYSSIVHGIIFLILCGGVQAQSEITASDSYRKFVQEFYDWYLKTTKTSREVIDQRGALFAPELLALLKKDQAYEAADLDLAFDADYFTLCQDSADSYVVGKPKRTGSTYRVPLYGIRDRVKSNEPELWAEAQRLKEGWQFVNFHNVIDGKPYNLMNELRRLQMERAKARKR